MSSTGGRTEMAVILFTDQVGSTEMLSTIGDLAADSLRRDHDRIVEAGVVSTGGRVVKWTGDGVLAAFDAASSAVLAGVEIQRSIKAYNRRHKLQVPLLLRIGISAGDVTWEANDYFGTPVVEAKRLESSAPPGGILVADVVKILAGTRTGVEIRSVGAIELKGLSGPVNAHEVVWDIDDDDDAEAGFPLPDSIARPDRFSLVGRVDEMARLRDSWDKARSGEIVFTMIGGEAGLGKTRLSREFARDVHASGALVLAGRQDEGLSTPFQPFMQALRFHVDRVPGALDRLGRNPPALTRLLPELADKISNASSPSVNEDPETEMYRLFDAVESWLVELSADEPLLLLLDDIHWCPSTTLLLLRHLVRSDAVAPLMIVATFRDTEIDATPAFMEFLRTMRRESKVARIDLEGLDETAIEGLVRQCTIDRQVTLGVHQLAALVKAQTAGNSYFASELVTALTSADGEAPTIPESVQDIVLARVEHLSPEAGQLLEIAALAGAEFRLDVVAVASETSQTATAETLAEAVSGRLLQEVAGSTTTYRFQHELVRSTLDLRLPGHRRSSIHHRLAAAYQATLGEDALGEIVSHLARSNEPDDFDALYGMATKAGSRAVENFQFDRASQIYDILLGAVRLRRPEAKDLIADTIVRLGVAQRRSHHPDARRTLLEAGELARELALHELEVRAALTNSRGLVWVGDPSDAALRDQFERALMVCDREDYAARARLLANLSVEHRLDGRTEQHNRLADEAIELVRRSGDTAAFAAVLNNRNMTMWRGDNAEQRFDLACELRDMSDGDSSPIVVGAWTAPLVFSSVELGRLDEATAAYDVLRAAAATGGPSLRYNAALAGGVHAVAHGQIDAARAHAEDVVTIGRLAGQVVAPILSLGLRFGAAFNDGTTAALAEELDVMSHRFPSVRSLRFGHAYALASAGRVTEAVARLDEWWDVGFGGLDNDRDQLNMLAYAAWVAWCGNVENAAAGLIENMTPHRDVVGCNGTVINGVTSGWMALMYALAGDHARSEAEFEHCLERERAIPLPTSTARVLVHRAICRLDRPAADVEGAIRDASEAVSIAEQYGLSGTGRQASDVLERAQGRPAD